MAGPLRGGGGAKGRAIKEKRTFFERALAGLSAKNVSFFGRPPLD